MAKLYTPSGFRRSVLLFVLVNDPVGAQKFFADELYTRILLSGLPMSSDAKAVASVGWEVFGEYVADEIVRRCVNAACDYRKDLAQ